tara:strand:+ start:41 stop:241 length:201 start_codon:yes stop_codon:yes gene_type:complete
MTPKDYLAHAARLSRELEAHDKRTENALAYAGVANEPQMDTPTNNHAPRPIDMAAYLVRDIMAHTR